MKNLLITNLLFIMLPLFSFGQSSSKIDSLILELQTEETDTGKVDLTNSIASYYRNINLKEAEKYGQQSLELAKRIAYTKGEIKALYTLSVISRMQGNMDYALALGKIGLSLASKNKNWRWTGSHSTALGNTYSSLGIFDTAMIYYIEATKAYDQSAFPEKNANVYNNIGNMLYKQKKDNLALEYLTKALKIYEESNQMKSAAMTLMNLGRRAKNDSLAMGYFLRSLDIHTKNNNVQGVASVSMNIGSLMMANKNYEGALPYYSEALILVTQVGHKTKMATAHSSLGKIYYRLNDQAKAIEHYEAAIALSKKSKFREEEKQTYNNLALLYADQKNHAKAFEYLKTSRDMGDSLVNEKSLAISSELEAKYNAKEKETELAQQQLTIERQKNNRNKLLIGGILLLLAITAVFQRYYYHQKRKKQEALLALEKKKTETEALQMLDELKTNFFANISHELKTPLSMIITPLEEALLKSSDDNLLLAHNNSKKLLRLIKEILDLSKLEAGQLELKETPVLLSQLTSRIFQSFQTLTKKRKIDFSQHFDLPQYLKVSLDVEKFEKILSNLLSNAVKFSNDGGSIHMEINRKKTDSKFLSIKVIDSGLGISEKDLEQIFNRFYQSEHGKKAGGTGIGLALSKELALLFGGELKASSEVNKGSVFTLEIPLKEVKHNTPINEIIDKEENFINKLIEKQGQPIPYHAVLINDRKAKILIVEDNEEMSDFLLKILSPYYDIQTAANGREAIQKINNTQFDLITSDVMMPEMNGFELRSIISKNDQLRQTPFIMLTASSLEKDKLKGLSLGIDDYITKPFNSRELLARINNLLKNKQERDRFQKEDKEQNQPETVDHQLLKHAEEIVMKYIHDPHFKVPDLAKQIGYSQRQLTRIIKKLTGLSPVSFILEIRLQRAYQLFQDRQFSTVSEIRYEIGIESAAYFTTKFKERFGKSPKEYLVS